MDFCVTNTHKLSDFKFLYSIGQGSFGSVYLSINKKDNKYYAIKKLSKAYHKKYNKSHYITNEQYFLNYLKSEKIVKLYYAFEDKNYNYFVLEYYKHGTLEFFINTIKEFKEDEIKFIICEVIDILLLLRNKGVIYRDLKPENLVISDDFKINLIDLATCKYSKTYSNNIENCDSITNKHNLIDHSFAGSPKFISPEYYSDAGINYESDYWSLGVLLHILSFGKPPDFDIDIKKDITNNNLSLELTDLLTQLLNKDNNKRIGSENNNSNILDIINHNYLKDYYFSRLSNNFKSPLLRYSKLLYFKNNISINKNIINKISDDILTKSSTLNSHTLYKCQVYKYYIFNIKKSKILKLQSDGSVLLSNTKNKNAKIIPYPLITELKQKSNKLKIITKSDTITIKPNPLDLSNIIIYFKLLINI